MSPSVEVQMFLFTVTHAVQMLLKVGFRQENARAEGALQKLLLVNVVGVLG